MRHIQALDSSLQIDIVDEVRRLTVSTIIGLGNTEAQEGVFEVAYADYLRVLAFEGYEDDPHFGDFQVNLCLSGSGKAVAERKLAVCDSAILKYPDEESLYVARAIAHTWLDDFETAIRDLEFASALTEAQDVGDEQQFALDTWAAWIAQLQAGENPFAEEPPN